MQNTEQGAPNTMKSKVRLCLPALAFSRAAAWKRSAAAIVPLAALLLAGCNISLASTGISNSGSPIVIVNQTQAIFVAANCNGPTATTIQEGVNLVDLGPATSTCEHVAYPSETGYTQSGYVPVFSIHRATNSVLCVFHSGCNLRAGPDSAAPILFILPFGQRAQGRGSTSTGAIITDGTQYSWWEVVVPSTGQVADVYGILTVAF
jgi:hypothetical protein